jgi:hypothetical protein
MLFFASANTFISDLSHQGLSSIYYFSSGGTLFIIGYFYMTRKNSRVVLYTEGVLDWRLVYYYVVGAAFEFLLYVVIMYTFKLCGMAGLNIGIAQTIWGFNPLLSSLVDFAVFGNRLEFY